MPPHCIKAGVPTMFREAEGNIHGFINLRKAIPSSDADIAALRRRAEAADRRGSGGDERPYRYRAARSAIMLLNREGKVFVGQRIDTTLEAWQMPQGGLDKGEDAEAGALRELEEETGIKPELVEIIAPPRRRSCSTTCPRI